MAGEHEGDGLYSRWLIVSWRCSKRSHHSRWSWPTVLLVCLPFYHVISQVSFISCLPWEHAWSLVQWWPSPTIRIIHDNHCRHHRHHHHHHLWRSHWLSTAHDIADQVPQPQAPWVKCSMTWNMCVEQRRHDSCIQPSQSWLLPDSESSHPNRPLPPALSFHSVFIWVA